MKDESGLGGTAVIEGAVDWSKEDGRGALRFDGGFVRVADHARLRFKKADSFTLAAWLKPPPELVNGAWQGVVTKPRGRAAAGTASGWATSTASGTGSTAARSPTTRWRTPSAAG